MAVEPGETRQQRRARVRREKDERKRQSVATGPPVQTSVTPEPRSIRAWEFSVGIPGALLAIGIGLAIAGSDYFWPGVYLAYGAIAWLLADWWFFSKPLTPGKRVTGAATTLVFAALVSWMAFRPSPLGIFAISEDTNFEPDTEIYGIKWGPNYFPMKLVISNESASPYADLEIIVRTDLMIKEIGSSAGPKCSYSPYLPGVLIANPTMTHTNARGKSVTIPIQLNTGSVFKINCEKILAKEVIGHCHV